MSRPVPAQGAGGEPAKRRGRPSAGGRRAILTAALELLRERGIARLTTREVARRAGVSEASVFYHYGDRAGLLRAVLEEGVRSLEDVGAARPPVGTARLAVLTGLGRAVESFLGQALPVLAAAASDPELRATLAAYLAERDLGLHRGVLALGGYLAAEQAAGRIRADLDLDATAFMFISSCYARASMRQMALHDGPLPTLESVAAALDASLEAAGGAEPPAPERSAPVC